jgi:hypothetical protein
VPSARSRPSTGDSCARDAATQYTPKRRSPWRTSRIGWGSTLAATVDLLGAGVVAGVVAGGAVVGVVGAGEAAGDGAGVASWPDWSAHAAAIASRTSSASSRAGRPAARRRGPWEGHVMVLLLSSMRLTCRPACDHGLGACRGIRLASATTSRQAADDRIGARPRRWSRQ